MRRMLPALAAPALLFTACGAPAEDPPSTPPPTTVESEATPIAPDAVVAVTASTTHDDGAIFMWGDEEQMVADGSDFSMTLDQAPEPGTDFELTATGAAQTSSVTCQIYIDGKTAVSEHGAGSMASATCVMPAVG